MKKQTVIRKETTTQVEKEVSKQADEYIASVWRRIRAKKGGKLVGQL